jgi:DNA-binding transcriptional LysR family regulator
MAPQWADRIKLRQLRVVLAVDEQGSITRAAEHLFITQAAVSKVIAEIEALIGADLFERRGRIITPTDAGHHVIRTARRVVSELKLLGEEVDLISEGGAGLLIIGLQAISILQIVVRVVAAMKLRNPRITIRLVEDTLPTLLRELRAGRVDLVFGRIIRGLLKPDLDGAQILSEPYVVIASCGHGLLQQTTPDWEEACAQVWCLPLPGTPIREHFADSMSALRLAMPVRVIETVSATTMAALLQTMPLLALAPANLAEQWARSGVCVITPLQFPARPEPIGLIWSATAPLSPSGRIFRSETLAMLRAPPVES